MTATILQFPTVALTPDRHIDHDRLENALMKMRAILPASAYAVLRTVLEWTCFLGRPEEVFMLSDFREYSKLRDAQAEWAIQHLCERGLITVKEKTHFGDYLIQPNFMALFNIAGKPVLKSS